MKLTDILSEHEALCGKPSSTALRNCVEKLDRICNLLTARGREDCAKGYPMISTDAFMAWGIKATHGDEMAEDISYLMQQCYMEGYSKPEGCSN